jgi:hypothetical protein
MSSRVARPRLPTRVTVRCVTDEYVPRVNFFSRMGAGVVGGVASGLFLGLSLTALGLFDDRKYVSLYGLLIGDGAMSTAWVMLLVVAGALGGVFGTVLGRFITGQIVPAIGVGLVWGIVSWIVLALLVLPVRGDYGVFSIKGSGGILTLGIYTLFGVVMTVVYAVAGPRRRYHYRRRYDYGMVVAAPARRRRRKHSEADD